MKAKVKKSTTDYRYIRAWGSMMGSYNYYIDAQIEQARQDEAPQTATFRNADGSWSTFADISRPDTRAIIESIVKR